MKSLSGMHQLPIFTRWVRPLWSTFLIPVFLLGSCQVPLPIAESIAEPLAISRDPTPYPDPVQDKPSISFETPVVNPSIALLETPQVQAAGTPNEISGYTYQVQSGDTLDVVAKRFKVNAADIHSPDPISAGVLLSPGQILQIPEEPVEIRPVELLLPDSEVVFSPSAYDFDVAAYLEQAGGFLGMHREYLRSTGWTSAADIISRVAIEYSINPRLLLALLEYDCECVLGQPGEDTDIDFLLNVQDYRYKGLYRQLDWAASQLSEGYYGWRTGALIDFQSSAGIMASPSPALNAGSIALMVYYAQKYMNTPGDNLRWKLAIHPHKGLPKLHEEMFGDAWERARSIEPLLPGGLTQPLMALPFEAGALWSYTSGPHAVWGTIGAQAALDFAPAVPISGCVQTEAWVVAVGNGLVVRSSSGVVVQDLDVNAKEAKDEVPVDGLEQTGWAVLYLHVAEKDRVAKGQYLQAGERIGHPSCEGGRANGTHVHIARKYNGEWVPADSTIPFILSGWTAHAGSSPYQGTLTNGEMTVNARPNGSRETQIMVPENDG